MRNRQIGIIVGVALLIGIGIGVGIGSGDFPSLTGEAFAGGGIVKSPNGVAPDRYVYYPGTARKECVPGVFEAPRGERRGWYDDVPILAGPHTLK